ncbi:putative alpha-galactosidase D [Talaromyces islandicus]|uniref:Alpha-galactosidase n=1 Tax=Talaromyces islandicus TaxID=28573 RepID=A0A0U1LLS0_TALIS|nr:putative alpha-galactosidase D [Talaromyces islandicus]
MISDYLLYSAILATVVVCAPVKTHLQARIENGLAVTPPMGWNSYNHYSCSPNETIIKSNAKALVDLGLDKLGYRYVTTDCGWTVADRLANGSLTWNETLFPNGMPALGDYIHGLGLKFGVYEDAGIETCGTGIPQAGSLYHEQLDADTFAAWGADALKYDNCYSDAATGYPNVAYEPSTSPSARYQNMTNALSKVNRKILFQICEWGVDFPALWAPNLGNSWRIGNDIMPEWKSIFRIINQAAPQTSFAGPGQWPDLDMLEVGNGIFTTPEEQTHFSLWAILKSPLVIGGALKDAYTSIGQASLSVLNQPDVIGYNQDSLGQSASLVRRWSDDEYDVWSGPLSENRTVVALVNWANTARTLELDLSDVGIQYAATARNIWAGSEAASVKTLYSASVEPHGTILLELSGTSPAGYYATDIFATSTNVETLFSDIYAVTDSGNFLLVVHFTQPAGVGSQIDIQVNGNSTTIDVPSGSSQASANISLAAGTTNNVTIGTTGVSSINISNPPGTYYPSTSFARTGSAVITTCGQGYCQPVGSKIGYLTPSSIATITIPAKTAGSKYVLLDVINNDITFSSTLTNSRNITVSVNGGSPVRLEVPLTGRHSELFGPGDGWWDPATFGVLVPGWEAGNNSVSIGNQGGEEGLETYAADFVGLRVLD